MLRKFLIAIATLLVLWVVVTTLKYQSWRSSHLQSLASGSLIAETTLGPIEYALKGKSGPVLLFLHGTPGGYDQGLEEDPGLRVLSPSRPGYLKTSLKVGKTPAQQAAAYIALLDALGIDSVIVAGASGGGPSAIAFAALYPQRTIALIAIEAVSQSETIPEIPGFLNFDFLAWVAFSAFDWASDEAAIEMMIPDVKNQQLVLQSQTKIKTVRALIWSMWPPSLRESGTYNDFEQFSDLSLPVDQIKSPTLVIHGTADINVPFSHGEFLANAVPGAIFHVVKDGDHMMPFSHEEEVEAAIGRFIETVIQAN